ncbi:histidine kinase [Nitriliruptoraceae bacterium ZYF776]|nr:histidine kinase [Profundirhabdus halotolerans]
MEPSPDVVDRRPAAGAAPRPSADHDVAGPDVPAAPGPVRRRRDGRDERGAGVDVRLLRRLRVLLAVGAVLGGTVGLWLDPSRDVLGVVGAYAAAMTVSLAVSHRRRDLRPWLAVDGTIAVLAVLATGGSASPMLPALLGPMLLSGILRSVLVTAFLLIASAPTLLLDGPPAQGATLFGVLVVAALVGSTAELLLGTRPPPDAALLAASAEHERIARLAEVLHSLEGALGERFATSTRARLLSVRRWTSLVDEPDVIGLRVGDGVTSGWQLLGADDQVRASADHELPAALVRAGTFQAVTLLAEVDAGAGLDPSSRRAAYLWLSKGDAPLEVLALEWPTPRPFTEDERRFFTELQGLFDLQRATGAQLERLQDRNDRADRAALAASLHDELAQDLVYAAMEVDRAARRHPDDPALGAVVPVLRGAVGTVRHTITDLRAAAHGVERALGQQLARAVAGRARFVAASSSDAPFRAEVVAAVVDVVDTLVELTRAPTTAVTVTDRSSEVPHVEVDVDGPVAGLTGGSDGGRVDGPRGATAAAVEGLAEEAGAAGLRLRVRLRPGASGAHFTVEGVPGGDEGPAGG